MATQIINVVYKHLDPCNFDERLAISNMPLSWKLIKTIKFLTRLAISETNQHKIKL